MWTHCGCTHLDENKEHLEIQGKEQSSMYGIRTKQDLVKSFGQNYIAESSKCSVQNSKG